MSDNTNQNERTPIFNEDHVKGIVYLVKQIKTEKEDWFFIKKIAYQNIIKELPNGKKGFSKDTFYNVFSYEKKPYKRVSYGTLNLLTSWHTKGKIQSLKQFIRDNKTKISRLDYVSKKQWDVILNQIRLLKKQYDLKRSISKVVENSSNPIKVDVRPNEFSISPSYHNTDKQLKEDKLIHELDRWKKQVKEDSKWLPVKLIADYQLPTENLYQPVYLSPLDRKAKIMTTQSGEIREFQLSQSLYKKSLSALSIHSLLSHFSPWSILIGIPGSGKTSSMKWLLRQTLTQNVYDYAIFIELAQLNEYLEFNSNTSLFSFFFAEYLGYKSHEAENIGIQLKNKVAQKDINMLFLFDGLDEVPPERRTFIIQNIYKELGQEKTVISSRPSATSTIFTIPSASFYDIIPLPPASIRNLVNTYCQLASTSIAPSEILKKISDNIALQRLAVTPFLLVLILEILNHNLLSGQEARLNQAILFSKLVQLIQFDNNQNKGRYPIMDKHLKELQNFAESLSFAKGGKRIKGALVTDDHSQRTLSHSRFLNEVGLNLGEFEFVHLRLQEYFTALSLCQKEDIQIKKFIEANAFDLEWLEVTYFFAGCIRNTHLEDIMDEILKKQIDWIQAEQTGNGWYRLAKLYVAKGHNLKTSTNLGVNIYEKLLNFILRLHPLYEQFIELLLESEGISFIHDLMDKKPIHEVWSCIYRLTPLSMRKRSGLFDFVHNTPDLAHLKGMRGYGFLDEKELIKNRKILKNWNEEELKNLSVAIKETGISSDFLAIELLEPILDIDHDIIFRNAATALSNIGGNKAACILANSLIDPKNEANEKKIRALADALSLSRYKAIEPQSKNILFNWLLKQKVPYPANTEFVLLALQGVRLTEAVSLKLLEIFLSDTINYQLKTMVQSLIPSLTNVNTINKLLNEYFLKNKKLPMKALGAISFIPEGNQDIVDLVLEKMKENDRIRMACIELLLKTHNRYPSHPEFAFIPAFVNKEFQTSIEKGDQFRFRVNLWQIITSIDSTQVFLAVAWEDLFSENNSKALKSAALYYIDNQPYTPTPEHIEQLKMQLTKDHKQEQLKEYVAAALNYILSRSTNKGGALIAFIKNQFEDKRKEFFIESVLKDATLIGQLVIS